MIAGFLTIAISNISNISMKQNIELVIRYGNKITKIAYGEF